MPGSVAPRSGTGAAGWGLAAGEGAGAGCGAPDANVCARAASMPRVPGSPIPLCAAPERLRVAGVEPRALSGTDVRADPLGRGEGTGWYTCQSPVMEPI